MGVELARGCVGGYGAAAVTGDQQVAVGGQGGAEHIVGVPGECGPVPGNLLTSYGRSALTVDSRVA
jgi:hypothetical protein